MSRLDFLVLVLQSSNSFNLNAFFNFVSIFFILAARFMFSFCLWGLAGPLFCSPCQDWKFCFFFVLKSSNGYSIKLMFSEGLSFFVFVLYDGALNFLRHVVELSLSVTM